jgi:RNA polymerase sigma factor (sigma-70 family)
MDRHPRRAATQPEAHWEEAETMDGLYRRHAPWLGAVLRKRFGQGFAADAEDVVQETYARLVPQAPGDIRQPRALLMRVALNLAKDLLRRKAVRERHLQAAQVEPSQGGALDDAVQDLMVKDIILSIPAPYRDVFVLSRFHGLTYEEIAARCDLSVKAVEWRLSKAIDHCSKRVQD